MKKSMKLLACALLIWGTTTQATSYIFESGKGFIAGALATLFVNHSREYVSLLITGNKNVDRLKVYDNYGICRERLAGTVDNAVALWGISCADKVFGSNKGIKLGRLTAQMAGIFVGSTATKYVTRPQTEVAPAA